jgi:Sulfatase
VTIDGNAIVGTHNVLFITLDSLRYDVARDALHRGTTPHVATVLPRGEWEERNSHAIFTFPAHQAFFAGFLPVPLGPRRHDRLFACRTIRGTTIGARTLVFDAPNIVSGFEQFGYRTVCIGGVGFFSRQTALGNVLPALFAESHWSPALGVDSYDSTEAQVRLALRILDSRPGPAPMFLFVNVSATHVPHHGYLSDGIEDSVASQAAALSYADHHLGHLFDWLPRYGPWLVIICADHGDAFGEEGLHGHARPHSVVWSVPYAEFLLPTV